MTINETKDVLNALNKLSLEMIKVFKDGAQMQDIAAVLNMIATNEDLKVALYAAYKDISSVPSELKDIDVMEAIELAQIQLSFVPQIVASLKA